MCALTEYTMSIY